MQPVHTESPKRPVPADPWWRGAVIYQIWPRSFCDANGDGIGDLQGIIRRLDHLNDGADGGLGVDAIWLSPIYQSPLADFGYDISDHTEIDPTFGTVDDFDQLVREAHERSMRVILDLVPNHTSIQHPWFEESRSSRESSKRAWYVWRDPGRDGGPPNNWWSAFASVGPAWTFDARTGQYYLHSYTADQPDLDWDNPEVREAVKNIMRFWLDRGVDGFRIDVVHRLGKDPEFRDNPPTVQGLEPQGPGRHDADWPSIDSRLSELRAVADGYGDVLLVGEAYVVDQARALDYVGQDRLHLAHNFEFLQAAWESTGVGEVLFEFERLTGSITDAAWCLGNHDHQRIRSRFDDEAGARAAALLLLALRGSVFVYQGDELGLPDTDLVGVRPHDINGRDPVRTPLPWEHPATAGPGAGFTTGMPWLPLEPDVDRYCADVQAGDARSMLNLYRQAIRERRASPALRGGTFQPVLLGGDLMVFDRVSPQQTVRVIVNFSSDQRPCPEAIRPGHARFLIGSALAKRWDAPLEPFEARWLEVLAK